VCGQSRASDVPRIRPYDAQSRTAATTSIHSNYGMFRVAGAYALVVGIVDHRAIATTYATLHIRFSHALSPSHHPLRIDRSTSSPLLSVADSRKQPSSARFLRCHLADARFANQATHRLQMMMHAFGPIGATSAVETTGPARRESLFEERPGLGLSNWKLGDEGFGGET
jgi:hypothetical protein